MLSLRSITTMRVLYFSFLIAAVVVVSSCQNNNQNSNDPGVISTDCVNNPTYCQTNTYNNQAGFQTYPYNNGYGQNYYNDPFVSSGSGPFRYIGDTAYLCNCPIGYVPTYNNYNGLGCVQVNYLGGVGVSGYAYFGYSNGGNGNYNNQWVNIPQISNTTGYTSRTCYNGVVQSCVVTDQSTCSVGYTCRASSAASALGMCVGNGANGQTGSFNR